MEPIAKPVYPTPPPTTNNLTTKQRSLLLRKAKKIEQILGYPPQLVDTLYNSDGTTPSPPPFAGSSDGRSSLESSSSSLTCSQSLDEVSRFCYPQGRRNSAPIPSHNNGLNQIPLLRTASKSLRLELSAVTNLPAKPNVTMNLTDELHGSHETYAPFPDSDLPLRSSLTDPAIVVPTFTIPTSHTHRKAKMDRIRKRLGAEVPCEVVFPEGIENGDSFGRKSLDSEKLMPRRGDAFKKLDSPHRPNPSQWHLERRRPPPVLNVVNQRLSLIPESPDESFGWRQELVGDIARSKDRTAKRRGSADSRLSMYSQSDDGHGQGALAYRRRTPSYRKPPPPMLDDSVCSF